MKKNTITFSELREFLLDLGFREASEKTRLRFVHPDYDAVLLFRRYRPKEIVTKLDLFAFQRQLVYSGVVEESDLDRFLQEASA